MSWTPYHCVQVDLHRSEFLIRSLFPNNSILLVLLDGLVHQPFDNIPPLSPPIATYAQKMGVAVPGFDIRFTHVTGCPWTSKGKQNFWGPPSTGGPQNFVASNLPKFFNGIDITQGRTRRATLAREINRKAKPIPYFFLKAHGFRASKIIVN